MIIRILCVLLCFYLLECNTTSVPLPDGASIHLSPCTNSAEQIWTADTTNSGKMIVLKEDSKCLDISGYGTSDGSMIWLYSCHGDDKDPTHQNQEWAWHTDTHTVVSTMSGKCMDSVYSGGAVVINTCSGASSQKWTYNSDGTIKNGQNNYCLTAGSFGRPCDNAQAKSLPYCNVSLPRATRIADLIKRIPTDAKVGLFGNSASGIPAIGLPGYQWWSEALHGVGGSPGVSFTGTTPVATSFPQVCLTGATFDKALFHTIGQTISTEARAFNNAGNAGLTFWAPNLNIFRDPRWGRGQETAGEDPYLTSEYVRNFVTGMQKGEDANYLKVSSCCKHYAAYSVEDYNGVDRHHFDATVSDQDLADTYFPAFAACISPDAAGASGIMCSYNAVNGVPSCANPHLLTDIARKSWKFDGYITSDCGAVDDVQYTHKYTSNTDQTCSAVLSAGMDIDCGSFLQPHLPHALSSGAVNMSLIDRALTNLFSVQMRLGIFDPSSIQPYMQIQPSAVNTPQHQAYAETAALEGIVLLKNDANTLPLTIQKTVAAIGPHAKAAKAMQGNYEGNAPFLISPFTGLSSYYTVNYSMGTDISGTNTNGFADACRIAKAADATVLFIGIDQSIESEGHDRTEITLPGVQDQLVSSVVDCSKGPVVVVVLSGSSLDLNNIKNNPKVKALLWAGYPGQAGGSAIAKIISGKVSPSGRLPFTIYHADYAKQSNFLDMGMRPNNKTNNPGRTYRFYPKDVIYPFGYGLSYTTFDFQWSNSITKVGKQLVESQISSENYSPFTASVLASSTVVVTNTGKVKSDVTVLCFVVGPQPGVNGNPIKKLMGFERIFGLAAGAKAKVTFPVSAHDLSYTNESGELFTTAGEFNLVVEKSVQKIIVV